MDRFGSTALVLLSAAVFGAGELVSQEPPGAREEANGATTALVLSGGGSRGLAHAGALLGLEQLGHDPDLVVGTSMGALIGALYAAGYAPEEIQRRIHEVDWGETFTPAPLVLGPDRVVRYPLFTLDSDPDPLRFNRGFLPQWRVNRALVLLLFDANARSRGDFDRLPRRYRAVAADLFSGGLVVLAAGDLARAVRASMAVPGVLAPVEWDGLFLVDGGIADNLPVGVARGLSAERIIAVDVRNPTEKILGRTPLQVANRALDIMLRNARQDTVPPDMLLVPEIPPSGTGLIFPPDPTPLFQLGLEAALRDAEPANGEARDPRRRPPAPPELAALRIEAPDPALEALARAVFAEIAPGPYDPDRVLAGVDRLYTTGFFEAVWPRVEGDDDPTLVVRLEAPPKVSFGGAIGYDSDRGGRVWSALQRSGSIRGAPAITGAAASLTALEQWGELSARIVLPRWPVVGWGGGVYLQETDVRQFGPDALFDQEVVRAGGWAGIEVQGALANRVLMATLRGEWIGVEDGIEGFSGGPLVRVTVPAPEVPIVGIQPEAELELRWGSISYLRWGARGSRWAQIGPVRLAVVGDLAATSSGAPPDSRPALGDAHAVPGYRWGEGRDRARAVAGIDIAHPIPFQGYVRSRLRAGAGAGELDSLWERDPWIGGVELGVIWRTPLGILAAAWAVNSGGEQQLSVDVGSVF